MKILFLSNLPMSSTFVVGSHQLAKQYSLMGHDVAHVSSPVSIFHAMRGKVGRAKFKASLTRPFSNTFQVYDDIPCVPFPYAYFGAIDQINDRLVARYLKNIEFDQPDIIYIDQPAFIGALRFINPKCVIYRPTDIYAHMHQGRNAPFEVAALKLCDGVITTSDAILAALGATKPSLVVTNGVDLEKFTAQAASEVRSGAVYVGALDERFDFEAVRLLAEQVPSLKIDLYGPIRTVLPTLPANCTYKNQINYEDIPKLLAGYEMALLPLSEHPANQGRSPMKLFEYLASGTPVLSSTLASFEGLSFKGLYTYRDVSDINSSYNKLRLSLAELERSELIKEAAQHSWKTKANQMLNWATALQVKNIPGAQQ